MSVKQKIMNLINYTADSRIPGTFMTRLQPLEFQQQQYNNSDNMTPDDIAALFRMNAIESSSDLLRHILSVDNPASRGKIAMHCWRILND